MIRSKETKGICEWKLRPGRDDVMVLGEMGKAATFGVPLVEIAHHHRRQRFLQAGQLIEHGAGLPLAPQPDKAEMHADDPDLQIADLQIGQRRSARLQRRQHQPLAAQQFDVLAHQDRVAVPAEAARPHAEADRPEMRHLRDQAGRQRRQPVTEPAIDLLQRDDVGIEFGEDVENLFRPPAPVGADALADIVGRDTKHETSFPSRSRDHCPCPSSPQ